MPSAPSTPPTLVIDAALPNGQRRNLEGEWHGAADTDLAALLGEFFASS